RANAGGKSGPLECLDDRVPVTAADSPSAPYSQPPFSKGIVGPIFPASVVRCSQWYVPVPREGVQPHRCHRSPDSPPHPTRSPGRNAPCCGASCLGSLTSMADGPALPRSTIGWALNLATKRPSPSRITGAIMSETYTPPTPRPPLVLRPLVWME